MPELKELLADRLRRMVQKHAAGHTPTSFSALFGEDTPLFYPMRLCIASILHGFFTFRANAQRY
ncbi:hypothetical protein, partial [Agathobaculum sp.]|uniref:hypothetical protein n=1 Tax=Agathobaculum sp. TaxID=2048138 RepID=UPI00399FC0ED